MSGTTPTPDPAAAGLRAMLVAHTGRAHCAQRAQSPARPDSAHSARALRTPTTRPAPPDAGIGWTPAELGVLQHAGLPPRDLPPLALDVRRELVDLGAVIVGVEGEADPSPPTELRHEAASILKRARRRGRELAIALRDALHERLAICTIDGGLCDAEAWHVAAIQLREGVRCGA